MQDLENPDKLPLPRNWAALAKRAVLCAVSMASTALVVHLERWANGLLSRARALAEIERRDAEIARLKERLRLIAARLAKVPPRRRPHYSPPDRLAILELRAAEGWTTARTARELLVDEDTIREWMRTLCDEGEKALTRIPVPVNRFPDFVRYVVRRLKGLCPAMGKVKIAQILARAAPSHRADDGRADAQG